MDDLEELLGVIGVMTTHQVLEITGAATGNRSRMDESAVAKVEELLAI